MKLYLSQRKNRKLKVIENENERQGTVKGIHEDLGESIES